MERFKLETTFKTGFDRMNFDSVSQWLKDAYWSPGISRDEVVLGAKNSSLVVGGFDEAGEQISYMRIISDKVRFAYILDVIVDPICRGQGIGRAMVRYAMEHPEMLSVYQWVLKTRDAHGVYAKLGFQAINDPERWMVIQRPRS
jgi:ribosomal protein S18 acetylase RimI-like enzyme